MTTDMTSAGLPFVEPMWMLAWTSFHDLPPLVDRNSEPSCAVVPFCDFGGRTITKSQKLLASTKSRVGELPLQLTYSAQPVVGSAKVFQVAPPSAVVKRPALSAPPFRATPWLESKKVGAPKIWSGIRSSCQVTPPSWVASIPG